MLDLVEQKFAYGWSPEEIQFQHPSLSMGQIHSALSFYWDHAHEMDREILRRATEFDRLREQVESRDLAARLLSIEGRDRMRYSAGIKGTVSQGDADADPPP